jgi:hypothetical protein
MTRAEHDLPDLRVDVPTLEPDEAFLGMLAARAAGSVADDPPAVYFPGAGWRVGLAAASVAAVAGGVTWLAATTTGDDSAPPSPPPVTQPTDPDSVTEVPAQGTGSGSVDGLAPDRPGDHPDPSGSVPLQQQPGVGSTPGGTDPDVHVEQPGPPDHTGPPDQPGQADPPQPPEHTGPPKDPGAPEHTGPPEDPGRSGDRAPAEPGPKSGDGTRDDSGDDRVGGTGAAGER